MIVQFQGESREDAIINHFSLSADEEQEFFEYVESFGYPIHAPDDLIEKLHDNYRIVKSTLDECN